MPGYNEIAVGAEGLRNVLAVKAQTIEDFDQDGELEFQVVVELIDEVVCAMGPVTHRHALIYNLPSLSLALDVETMNVMVGVTHSRGTSLWDDQNDDGHPDIDLRSRGCADWAEDGTSDCVRQTEHHVFYLWREALDRWATESPVVEVDPCDDI